MLRAKISDFHSSVDRNVEIVTIDGQPGRIVTIKRQFPTSVENLWETVTTAERIKRWFAPVNGDFKLGGRFQIEGNASGEVQSCQVLSNYSVTWEIFGDVSWVTLKIHQDEENAIALSLSHKMKHSPHWDHYGSGATGVGWEYAFLGLYLYLTEPETPQLTDEQFAPSEDGKFFFEHGSNGWRDASVKAGEIKEEAEKRARATTAFYTGQPEPE